MHFMDVPVPDRVINSQLEGPALTVTIKFVDEFTSLKVSIPPPSSVTAVNTFPPFLVVKPHQLGQFRTVADGKSGGRMMSVWLTLVI